jgi:hypothetical protein
MKKLLEIVALVMLLLAAALAAACDPVVDESDVETVASTQEALTSDQVSKLMNAAQTAIGTVGGQCKVWVQNIVAQTLAITVPSTATNQLEWNPSTHTVVTAQWKATYAPGRFDQLGIGANATFAGTFNVPNGDPYVLVLYGSSWLSGRIISAANTTVIGPVVSSTIGVVSATFTGAGTYSVKITNSSASSQTFTAVVLSRSRFVSDFQTARRGDAMQMYIETSNGTTPHTAIVQTDFNSGSNNWVDSNWVKAETVGQHPVSVDQMMRWTARKPSYGFTVYKLQ